VYILKPVVSVILCQRTAEEWMINMKTIFVVDDIRINLIIAEEALSRHYNVITMLSASIMFDKLKKVTPDLILLDIMMPGLDGFEALKKMKGSVLYSDIPVIFLTSTDDAVTEAQAFEMGVVDFISKPFSDSVLLNRIRKHLAVEDTLRERTVELRRRIEMLTRLQNRMATVL
jgi:putative two-component system response regulator